MNSYHKINAKLHSSTSSNGEKVNLFHDINIFIATTASTDAKIFLNLVSSICGAMYNALKVIPDEQANAKIMVA